MKTATVLILMGLSLLTAVILHGLRIDREYTDIDKLKAGLQGAAPYISKNAHIGFAGEPANGEVFSQARYILAPRVLLPGTAGTDTVLIIKKIGNSDSALAGLLHNSTIIWQHTDEHYQYTLAGR